MHSIFVILDIVSRVTCNICLATITLLIIGLTIGHQFISTKQNAIITIAADSLRFINYRIVSIFVE
jgi:hypothetical protein